MSKILRYCESCMVHLEREQKRHTFPYTNHNCLDPRCDCKGTHIVQLDSKEDDGALYRD